MVDESPIRPVVGLPPTETVEFFRQKGFDYQTEWDELWQADHGRAFTVTKILNADLLRAVRASLDKVLSEGGTFEMWKADIMPRMQAAGWWGKVEDAALTGVERPIWVGERRLRTIYDTNLRMARAAGAWKRIQALKGVAPYLQYEANDDRRTRPLHRKWGGLDTGKPVILPVDHPWWRTHFPPCGWNCRCTTLQLSEADLKEYGLEVSEPPDDGPPKSFLRSTGEIVEVPRGIDPGFAYSPGSAYLESAANVATSGLEGLATVNMPAARALLEELVSSPAFDEFMAAPAAPFPVMLIDDGLRDAIGATSSVVSLSGDTLEKQRRPDKHPELTIDDYRLLPALSANPDLVFQADDRRVILMRDETSGRWQRAVIKTTESGRANFLLSFAFVTDREVARLRRRDKLIFGQIAGALALLLDLFTDDELDQADQDELEA